LKWQTAHQKQVSKHHYSLIQFVLFKAAYFLWLLEENKQSMGSEAQLAEKLRKHFL